MPNPRVTIQLTLTLADGGDAQVDDTLPEVIENLPFIESVDSIRIVRTPTEGENDG